jgi:hypothetical protein
VLAVERAVRRDAHATVAIIPVENAAGLGAPAAEGVESVEHLKPDLVEHGAVVFDRDGTAGRLP